MAMLTRSQEAAVVDEPTQCIKTHYSGIREQTFEKRVLRSAKQPQPRRSSGALGMLTRSKQPFLNISLFDNPIIDKAAKSKAKKVSIVTKKSLSKVPATSAFHNLAKASILMPSVKGNSPNIDTAKSPIAIMSPRSHIALPKTQKRTDLACSSPGSANKNISLPPSPPTSASSLEFSDHQPEKIPEMSKQEVKQRNASPTKNRNVPSLPTPPYCSEINPRNEFRMASTQPAASANSLAEPVIIQSKTESETALSTSSILRVVSTKVSATGTKQQEIAFRATEVARSLVTPSSLERQTGSWLTPEQLISQHGFGAASLPSPVKLGDEGKSRALPCETLKNPSSGSSDSTELRIDDLFDPEAQFALPSPLPKPRYNIKFLKPFNEDDSPRCVPSFQWVCTPDIEMDDFEPADDSASIQSLTITSEYEGEILL